MKAIVATGGGLRCAFTAGVLHQLGESFGGLYNGIDQSYGCSGGAVSLVFHLAQQPNLLAEAIHSPTTPWHGLFNLQNLKRGKPLLDMPFLFDEMKQRGLRPEQATETGKLICVATDIIQGHPVYLHCSDRNQVWNNLAATTAVPYLHPAVHVEQAWLADGMFSDPMPLQRALDDGCKKIIVIDNLRKKPSRGRMRLIELLCHVLPLPLKYQYSVGKLMENARLSLSRTERLINLTPNVVVIRPRALPSRLSFNTSNAGMLNAFKEGIEETKHFFNNHPHFF